MFLAFIGAACSTQSRELKCVFRSDDGDLRRKRQSKRRLSVRLKSIRGPSATYPSTYVLRTLCFVETLHVYCTSHVLEYPLSNLSMIP